jgi:hypothetical protein
MQLTDRRGLLRSLASGPPRLHPAAARPRPAVNPELNFPPRPRFGTDANGNWSNGPSIEGLTLREGAAPV